MYRGDTSSEQDDRPRGGRRANGRCPTYRAQVRADRPTPAARSRLPLAPVARRDVVDHGLLRRQALREVQGGAGRGDPLGRTADDVRDASPYLLRSADELGVQTGRPCPLCGHGLREVSWVFGAALGPMSGSARTPRQLAALAAGRGEFDVHDVEVCLACRWNHLVRSWRAGDPTAPARPRPGRGSRPPGG